MRSDAAEHIAQIGQRIDLQPLAGRDEAHQHRSGLSTAVTAEQRPAARPRKLGSAPLLSIGEIAVLRVEGSGRATRGRASGSTFAANMRAKRQPSRFDDSLKNRDKHYYAVGHDAGMNVTIGIFEGARIRRAGGCGPCMNRPDEGGILLRSLFALENVLEKVDGIIIASVVPVLRHRCPGWRDATFPGPIGGYTETGLNVLYDNPREVSDRIVNAVAALAGMTCIVVDPKWQSRPP